MEDWVEVHDDWLDEVRDRIGSDYVAFANKNGFNRLTVFRFRRGGCVEKIVFDNILAPWIWILI